MHAVATDVWRQAKNNIQQIFPQFPEQTHICNDQWIVSFQSDQIWLILIIWLHKHTECHCRSIWLAVKSVCMSTGSKPLLLNNLINSSSASSHSRPLLAEQHQRREARPHLVTNPQCWLQTIRRSTRGSFIWKSFKNWTCSLHWGWPLCSAILVSTRSISKPSSTLKLWVMAYWPSHIRPGWNNNAKIGGGIRRGFSLRSFFCAGMRGQKHSSRASMKYKTGNISTDSSTYYRTAQQKEIPFSAWSRTIHNEPVYYFISIDLFNMSSIPQTLNRAFYVLYSIVVRSTSTGITFKTQKKVNSFFLARGRKLRIWMKSHHSSFWCCGTIRFDGPSVKRRAPEGDNFTLENTGNFFYG